MQVNLHPTVSFILLANFPGTVADHAGSPKGENFGIVEDESGWMPFQLHNRYTEGIACGLTTGS